MQRRYSHYLQKAAGGKWPSMVIAVDCEYIDSMASSGVALSTLTLTQFINKYIRNYDKGYGPVGFSHGFRAKDFWPIIYRDCELYGNVWLVSFDCNKQWSLLNLWEEIENGKLTFDAPEPRNRPKKNGGVRPLPSIDNPIKENVSAGRVSRMQEQNRGYLISEGPPSALRLRVAGKRRWITWIDLQNFGVTSNQLPDTMREVSGWIADTFMRMAASFKRCGLGSLRTTAGAQAMHGWRCELPKTPIYCTAKPEILELESQAYIGGRCEAYHIGDVDAPLCHLDFRSLYPSVCVNQELPTMVESVNVGTGCNLPVDCTAVDRMIAKVKISTDTPSYPLRRNGEVIYPIGRFWTVLAGPELMDAAKLDRIVEYGESIIYRVGRPLQEYASKVYTMRKVADTVNDKEMSAIVKRLLVALPGKLGQREQSWVDCDKADTDPPYGEWWGKGDDGQACRYRAIAGHVQREFRGGFMPDAVPSIAAFITSYGRMRLLDAIRCAGWEEVYYVDTDSLFVSALGTLRLNVAGMVRDNKLGYLRPIADNCRVSIRGIKHYVCDGKTTCAGLKTGTIIDKDGMAMWERSASPWEHARKGARPVAETVSQVLQLRGEYHHGIVTSTGRVTPIEIHEE